MHKKHRPEVRSEFRTDLILVPDTIRRASGIIINGRRYKSFLFSTDVAQIMYTDADAILAVYPYTPHPEIIKAVTDVAPCSVAAGVGGSITNGKRSATIATFADAYGCMAVVLNSKIDLDTIRIVKEEIDIPIIYTVISADQDVDAYIESGVDILNISGGAETSQIVSSIRERYPDIPIIATGGSKDKYIIDTIEAGANAISYTPQSTREAFQESMAEQRKDYSKKH